MTQVPPDEREATQQQWNSFLDKPGARAALLNFGIALMQPPSFGDNFASQFGRAVGAGAEAAQRGELQESKVGELEARSAAATARAGAAGERTGLEYFRRKSIESEGALNRQTQAFGMYLRDKQAVDKAYTKQKADIDKANELRSSKDQLPYPPPPPSMDYPTWLRVRGAGLLSATAAPRTTSETE
jgi:hypothetical protein